MLTVICDDDAIWLEQAKKMILSFGQKNSIDMKLMCFGDSETMFSRMEQMIKMGELPPGAGLSPDVLFLDIQLGTKENGIAAASKINERWPDCQIVYLTDYISYATHVYHTEHAFYILKKEFAQRIGEVFQKIFHEQAQRQKKLIFHMNKGGSISLHPREILYFERRGRITEINADSGIWQIKDSLAEIERQLPGIDFVRCHQSYIVYFPAIREYHKNWLLLNNGVRIDISRSYWSRCGQAFLQWTATQMKG